MKNMMLIANWKNEITNPKVLYLKLLTLNFFFLKPSIDEIKIIPKITWTKTLKK